MSEPTCPHCGAENAQNKYSFTSYTCGYIPARTYEGCSLVSRRSNTCYEREIAKKDSEIAALKEENAKQEAELDDLRSDKYPDGWWVKQEDFDAYKEDQWAKQGKLERELTASKAKSEERRALMRAHSFVHCYQTGNLYCVGCKNKKQDGCSHDCAWAAAMKEEA